MLIIWRFRFFYLLLHTDEKDRFDTLSVVIDAVWLVPDACRCEVHDADGCAPGGY